ncbi:hypothetical protein ONS95_015066 [Cadophora gregata]|uniref:uncharacterized protein n=1 Tax=Cadophora gregata TaxID=51156 RepID=UPI0026DB96E3|nr:uncharacterized protein ONS95_015066 [Cadophora gregata]KAK0101205.1 hypothetical protein ONS96_006427 [Cadophora gregata f. sp. sojae]KAK0115760.1 hypothetical protein ONS95_015066 [Cadophora gregata]
MSKLRLYSKRRQGKETLNLDTKDRCDKHPVLGNFVVSNSPFLSCVIPSIQGSFDAVQTELRLASIQRYEYMPLSPITKTWYADVLYASKVDFTRLPTKEEEHTRFSAIH